MKDSEQFYRDLATLRERQDKHRLAYSRYSSAKTTAALIGAAGIVLTISQIWGHSYGWIGALLAIGAAVYWRMSRSEYVSKVYDQREVDAAAAELERELGNQQSS